MCRIVKEPTAPFLMPVSANTADANMTRLSVLGDLPGNAGALSVNEGAEE
jgi:hypothetical protein